MSTLNHLYRAVLAAYQWLYDSLSGMGRKRKLVIFQLDS